MFSIISSLLIPMDRFATNTVKNLLNLSYVPPESLPAELVSYMVDCTETARFRVKGRFAMRVDAIKTADVIVGNFILWLDSDGGRKSIGFHSVDSYLQETFEKMVSPQRRAELFAHRVGVASDLVASARK
ncbi:MAG TPA: hypothetical protein VN039_08975 [Nitrospira sp.]|nr:hypothetical protein [Nitrospira sp.]